MVVLFCYGKVEVKKRRLVAAVEMNARKRAQVDGLVLVVGQTHNSYKMKANANNPYSLHYLHCSNPHSWHCCWC